MHLQSTPFAPMQQACYHIENVWTWEGMHQALINAGIPKYAPNTPKKSLPKNSHLSPMDPCTKSHCGPSGLLKVSYASLISRIFSSAASCRQRTLLQRGAQCSIQQKQRSHEANAKTYPSSHYDCWGFQLGTLKLPKFVGIKMEIPIYKISRSLRHWILFKLMKEQKLPRALS